MSSKLEREIEGRIERTEDPIHAEAERIVARWDAEEKGKQFDRALTLARHQASEEARCLHDAVPANWVHRMAKARCASLALTWEGAPVDPSMCIARGGLWSIDDEGIWVQPEAQPRQFVCSPVVETKRGGPFAALLKGKWVTIDRPVVDGRPPARAYAELVVKALLDAGVKFGPVVVSGVRADNLDRQHAARYVSIWLLGVDPVSDSIGNCPVRRLSDQGREDNRPDDVGGRQQLGEVLSRMPADVWRGR